MYPNVHCGAVYFSHDMEVTYMSIDRWLNKVDVVHIYDGILSAIKKEWNWVKVVMWMGRESVIQSEVSQKEKNRYCLLMHMYGI